MKTNILVDLYKFSWSQTKISHKNVWNERFKQLALYEFITLLTEESKNQAEATWYFIVLLIGSTCFKHYYAHHQELATTMLFTTLVVSFSVCCMLEVSCSYAGVVSGLQAQAGLSLRPGNYTSLTAPNLQHTANRERHDQCGKQHRSRELLMMVIVMFETCWAYKKYNKISSGICLVFLFFSYHYDAWPNKLQIIILCLSIIQ
jgi:hypothetical protein